MVGTAVETFALEGIGYRLTSAALEPAIESLPLANPTTPASESKSPLPKSAVTQFQSLTR